MQRSKFFRSFAALALMAVASVGAFAQSCAGAGTINYMAREFMDVANGPTLSRVGYAPQAGTTIVAPATILSLGEYVEYIGSLDAASICQAATMTIRSKAPTTITLSPSACTYQGFCAGVANDIGAAIDITLGNPLKIKVDGVTYSVPKASTTPAAPGTYQLLNTALIPRSFNSYPKYAIVAGGSVIDGLVTSWQRQAKCGSFLHNYSNPMCAAYSVTGGTVVLYQ